eukprot:TRINITY_DN9239_c0_g1_i1.p1 TRINITY_DN9239_c0_g1~~TRINITY_DN9239_c0_g1_i1.p1  ORF type:complete len:220 (+),score=88.34 TRINITY_DN9239_c0_g1_i1:40-660(+)
MCIRDSNKRMNSLKLAVFIAACVFLASADTWVVYDRCDAKWIESLYYTVNNVKACEETKNPDEIYRGAFISHMATIVNRFSSKGAQCDGQSGCTPDALGYIRGIDSDFVMEDACKVKFEQISSNIEVLKKELELSGDAAILTPNKDSDLWLAVGHVAGRGIRAFNSRGKEIWLKGDEFRVGRWVVFNFRKQKFAHEKQSQRSLVSS